MNIFYNGSPYAYAHLAALSYTDGASQHNLIGCTSFEEVIEQTKKTQGVGVLPVENSIVGPVLQNFISILKQSATIVGEITLPVHHHLFTASDNISEYDISRIYSHPKALAQCSQYIYQHRLETSLSSSTSKAAYDLAHANLPANSAVICSLEAGQHFGLTLINNTIQDIKDNFTRFLIVSNNPVTSFTPNTTYKTTFKLTVSHEPGSLTKVLQSISKADFNMSMLQSYPIEENPFSYGFIIDVECQTNQIDKLKSIINSHSDTKIIGTYKAS